MVLPVVQFQPETYEQTNPFMASLTRGMSLGNNLIQNALAAQQRREAIKQQKIRNQLLPDILQSNMLKQNLQSQNLQYQLAHPELNVKSDPISQAIWLDKVKNQYGEQSPIYQNALRSLSAKQTYYEGRGQLAQKRAKGYDWYSLPADVRKLDLAYARGMGYSDSEAQKLLSSGISLDDLARRKNTNLEKVSPSYPPTTATQSRAQLRESSQAEISSISPTVTKWLAPYSQGGMGTFKLLKDLGTGENSNDVAKYMAATAVVPDLSMMRARATSGGTPGIELVREFTNAAYNRLSNPSLARYLRSPEVFKKTQNYIDQLVKQMVERASKKALRPYGNKSQEKSSTENDPLGIR